MEPQFDRLTEGQKECLRLFHARWEVKDIARQIGRSPVTVQQRLATARKHLGVDRSAEAARLLVQHEGRVYDPTPYAPTIVADPVPSAPILEAEKRGERHSAFPLPFPTRERPTNDLSIGMKITYSVLLAAMIVLIFGGAVTALSGLSKLF